MRSAAAPRPSTASGESPERDTGGAVLLPPPPPAASSSSSMDAKPATARSPERRGTRVSGVGKWQAAAASAVLCLCGP